MNEPTWRPNPGPQTRFLSLRCFEKLYGGAAGGGKTDALLFGPLRWIHLPQFRALRLRRTFPELERSLMERARQWYPAVGGKGGDGGRIWRWPSGAVIEFGHLEHDSDVYKYQSAEYQDIGFDELTSFTEQQYTYMMSRARSAAGIPVSFSAGTNPGGEGHEWVFKRWEPWLTRSLDYTGFRAEPGQVAYYVNDIVDGRRVERWVDREHPNALSRVFVPARIEDNPHLTDNDPQYAERLNAMDPVTRAQLKDGNWMARPAAGAYFKRGWFKVLDAVPADVTIRCRSWDFAATVDGIDSKGRKKDPDWTAGVKMSRTSSGMWVIEHVYRFRGRPLEVEATVKSFAATDGVGCRIRIPEDPGQAGIAQAQTYISMLAGRDVHSERETGDKIFRAKPVSSQAEAGNIAIVRGDWNEAFLDELESFPEGKKDQVDALSGAFSSILNGRQGPAWLWEGITTP